MPIVYQKGRETANLQMYRTIWIPVGSACKMNFGDRDTQTNPGHCNAALDTAAL